MATKLHAAVANTRAADTHPNKQPSISPMIVRTIMGLFYACVRLKRRR
jgi:hypothetical protein